MGKNHFKIKIMLPCSFFSKKSLSVTLSCPNITVKEMLKNENKNVVSEFSKKGVSPKCFSFSLDFFTSKYMF